MSAEDITAFKGECRLVGWSDSSSRGKTCTLRFHDLEHDINPLNLYRPGARFAVVMVWIGDDEEPQKPKQRKRKSEPQLIDFDSQMHGDAIREAVSAPVAPQKLSNVAALLCKDPDFYVWAPTVWWGVNLFNEQTAKEFMCEVLGIKSRSELDKDPGVAQRFNDDIYTPFQEWTEMAHQVHKGVK